MASETGRKAVDLIELLKTEPQRFALGQALRLIGFAYAGNVVEWGAFIHENVSIRPWLSLAFPTSEILQFEEREDVPRFALTATGFGLYSTMGPLPTFYTEELLEEARRDESVSRDFLDIINNHLYHLLYAAEHHNRLERLTVESRRQSPAHIQFCLMGQAAPSLREPGLPRAVLMELLASRSRSAVRLESYLSHVLGRRDVEVEQCVECHIAIPREQLCRLGSANAVLGEDAMLGCRVRDSIGTFRLHLRSVAAADMQRFLPGRPGYVALTEHLRRYLDTPLEYELVLHPAPEPAPRRALGVNADMGFYLGTPETCPPVTIFWSEFHHAACNRG